jgi:hypothetical protein
MGYLGLVPSEHSSGEGRKLGRITRAGNGHARRILVEAAWAYRFRPRQSQAISLRSATVSPEVRRIAWRAQERLCTKCRRLTAHGKNKTTAAIARELAGFVWAIAREPKLLAQCKRSARMTKVADERTRPERNPRIDYGYGSTEPDARSWTEAAPDGFRSCGSQPANISLIRRRSRFRLVRRLGGPSTKGKRPTPRTEPAS